MKCLIVLLSYAAVGWCQSCDTKPGANLARAGDVSQSSDFKPNFDAGKVNDGNIQPGFSKHPCSHTNNEPAPWWKVDLKKTYSIATVIITHRVDCCRKRLLGAEIRIGNSADNNNPVCATITDLSNPTITLCCNGMVGQYVSVVLPGRAEFLTLHDVEVYGEESNNEGVNLALSGEARQSSTYGPEYTADKAIDGNPNPNSCTQTNNDFPVWWQLDLKKSYKVNTVVIVARLDCCRESLKGAEVHIGDTPQNNPLCDTINDISQTTITLSCKGLVGRYVSVVIPGRPENLTLCEVKVFGEEPSSQTSNLPPSGVNQSPSNTPVQEPALDLQPCTLTYNPSWWKSQPMEGNRDRTVVNVNQKDCCSLRLIGVRFRIGDWSYDNNPVCDTIIKVSQTTIAVSCKGIEGHHNSLVFPGRANDLIFCRVAGR